MQPFHASASLPRPVVAISACLTGANVRYDAGHKAQPLLLQLLTPCVHWLPLCPEVAAGMGVPRPPVQLRTDGGGLAVVMVDDPADDRTDELQQGVISLMQQLQARPPDAIVLKARSPSCGLASTPLFDASGRQLAAVDGVFARACRARFGNVPLLDENALTTAHACRVFALQLLMRMDIAHAGSEQQLALRQHYLGAGIDTEQSLDAQLAAWPAQRVARTFEAWCGG
jgi:uncharacterized protein YbbK (DUF523 family)